MAQRTNTFRVFVSSTFSDLKAERNAMQERVFPQLRKLAQENGYRFQAIDLRWGVSQEASIDQQTMNICLGEIERCQRVTPRPNFLVLMGDRYGWMPPPPQIPADEFERILAGLDPGKQRLLRWVDDVDESEDGIEMVRFDPEREEYVGDQGWYRLDNNAVPAEYALQPWEGFSYEAWGEIERHIHDALDEGARAAGLDPDPLFKYWASATHQEIDAGALRVMEAREHVHCFFREVEGYPDQFSAAAFLDNLDERLAEEYPGGLTEQSFNGYITEIKQIDLSSNAREVNDRIKSLLEPTSKDSPDRRFLEQVQGWLVDFTAKDYINLREGDWVADSEAFERQVDLKMKLTDHVPDNYRRYNARWTGQGITTDHIDQLCEEVYEALSGIILREIEEPHEVIIPGKKALIHEDDALDNEGGAHLTFAEERLAYFVGRSDILKAIAGYLNGDEHHVLGVYGGGGTGKSALTAKAIHEAQQAHPGKEIVYRFIGATPGSSDGRALLASLCREISRRYDVSESDIPLDYQDLVSEFGKRLALATAVKPLIVFLDSLDQLSQQGGARSLTWLLDRLPDHVHLMVTTRPEDTYERLKMKNARLEELGGLKRSEGDQLLEDWLRDAGRTLQEDQKEAVLDRFEQLQADESLEESERSPGNPLYLRLAFEEARLWPSGDGQPPEQLTMGVSGIIEHNLIDRLADESSHGEMLISKVLGYLAASRYGLAEDEMIDLLSRDIEMYEWFFDKSWHLPADLVKWAIQFLREEAGQPSIEERAPDKDEERAAQAWLKDPRNPPERVSEFLGNVLPLQDGPRLPVVLWSRLSLDLEPYLSERESEGSTLLTFYHRELNDVSKAVFLKDGNEVQFHKKLASYFQFKADPDEDGEWSGDYPRGLSELPYHQTKAELWDEVYETLTDFRFLEEKAAQVGVLESLDDKGNPVKTYTGVFQLQEDYDLALGAMPGGGGAGGGEHPLIITAVDRGEGLTVYCPVCNQTSPIDEHQLDSVINCPTEGCGRSLKINPFVTKMA